jgi:integrase/recombinase XerC
VEQLLDSYMRYLEVERNASPFTVRNYRSDLLDFFGYLREQKVAVTGEVDRLVLRRYLARLLDRKLVKASIARRLSAIRSFYRYLIREKVVPSNPLATTSSPKLERRLPAFLSAQEMSRLLAAPDISTPQGQRDKALLELLYASGLRLSEIVRLDLTHLNLQAREVRVWGKGSKERVVLMGRPAVAALELYLARGRFRLLGGGRTDALFVNRDGRRLAERRVQLILKEYALQIGLEKRVYPHLLRHTFATHLLDGGADLRVVQELLGHASLTSTQVYTHVTQSQARKVYLAAHPRARREAERLSDGTSGGEDDEDTAYSWT